MKASSPHVTTVYTTLPTTSWQIQVHHCGFQTSNAMGHRKTQLCFSCQVSQVPTIFTSFLGKGSTLWKQSLCHHHAAVPCLASQTELFTWTFCCGNFIWLLPKGGRQRGTGGEESCSSTGTQKSYTSGCSYFLQHDLCGLCCQVQGETNK